MKWKKPLWIWLLQCLLCYKCFSYLHVFFLCFKYFNVAIRILFITTKVVKENALFVTTSNFFIKCSYWLFWKFHCVFLRCLLCNPMGFLPWQSLKWMFCMYDGSTMQLLHKPLRPLTFPLMWIVIIISQEKNWIVHRSPPLHIAFASLPLDIVLKIPIAKGNTFVYVS